MKSVSTLTVPRFGAVWNTRQTKLPASANVSYPRRSALQAAPGLKARLFASHKQSSGLFVYGLSPR